MQQLPSSFSALGMPQAAVSALASRGIVEPFPIQSLVIPAALQGHDVRGKAPTGSGKTLAFGIPLAQRVLKGAPLHPRALVLAPTRELAAQICDELKLLLRPSKGTVASVYGGVGFGAQVKALRSGVDVIVGCPGRAVDLVNRGDLKLGQVEIVVIDEADRMADMGFLPDVKRLLDKVKPDRQTLLFSATLDREIDVLVKRYQTNPVTCDVASDDSHMERLTHSFFDTKSEDRVRAVRDLVKEHGSTLVFCRTRRGVDRVATQLKRDGVKAAPIHGGRTQSQRDRALAAFALGKTRVLVATDVAARGIHVDDVRCVIHFDVVDDHKDYIHRSGRTGRAGSDGVVISFVTSQNAAQVKKIRAVLDGKHGGQEIHDPIPKSRRRGRKPIGRKSQASNRPKRAQRRSGAKAAR